MEKSQKLGGKKSILFLFILILLGHYTHVAYAKVISSIKPIAFITQAIADGVIDTDILLPDGASPHSYSLTPLDIEKLKTAELVIWIGEDMETFLPNILKGISTNKQLELLEVKKIETLLDNHGHNHTDKGEHHHDHGNFDTHIWLSPNIAKMAAEAIHDKLLEMYPAKKQQLDANLNNFLMKTVETEQFIAKKLISVQNNGYFVFHDAYGYFERQFGLANLGSFTINPDIQPGAQKVYQIRRELLDSKAVCVFREPQFNPAIIGKVISGTHVRSGILDPLGMDISVSKDAYTRFLMNLSQQFLDCLGNKE